MNLRPQRRSSIHKQERAQHARDGEIARGTAAKSTSAMTAPNRHADTIMYVVNSSDRKQLHGIQLNPAGATDRRRRRAAAARRAAAPGGCCAAPMSSSITMMRSKKSSTGARSATNGLQTLGIAALRDRFADGVAKLAQGAVQSAPRPLR